MGGMVSFEDNENYVSSIALHYDLLGGKQAYKKELILASERKAMELFRQLSFIDYEIMRLYYFEGLTQQQIAKLLEITQGAISKRVSNLFKRLVFLLKMPNINPIQVRKDFQILFDDDLFDAAFYFYFEPMQNRVKHFIDTSQSGASNKFKKILEYLSTLKQEFNEKEISQLSLQEIRKYKLAIYYYDFFKETKERALQWLFIYKGNGWVRMNKVIKGPKFKSR